MAAKFCGRPLTEIPRDEMLEAIENLTYGAIMCDLSDHNRAMVWDTIEAMVRELDSRYLN